MERLVSIENGKVDGMFCCYEECCTTEDNCPNLQMDNCECLKNVLKKLAQYQQLEEQGLLLRLPCKVGDTVYQIIRVFNNFGKHYSIIKTEFRLVDLDLFELGYIFLTKEEAEQKLAEMKGEV